MSAHLVHGGALDAALARFGGRREDWLDLSTGINPVPPPLPALESELFARLPEAASEARARDAARRHCGAPAGAGVVAAPGSQALISLLPHLLPTGPTAILDPAYAEHARAFQAAGHDVLPLAAPEECPPETRVAVVVNPNNPDGRRFGRAALLALADALAARGGWLLVDEAFMDADPRESLAPDAGRPGLVVLRSFGKFFGLAGLRLGFALTVPDLADRLAERLGPWAVSGPALAVGERLMDDAALVRGLREAIARRAALTRGAIRSSGFVPTGDAALFALVEAPRAHALFEALARRHVLARPFVRRPDWLRLGLVRDEAEAARLADALAGARGDAGA
ncbi:threonine-phosphate decarboxylase [Aureimonas flava]|uniref:threonine-phosphate decarboxylase n=1 Tax=Aureimonas flava TaxID=2320271 RepID=A0A3A1WP45_9HYPH|nr:threonine-phosphate decarboxylase CobD [Aureimonas flava]RIX99071.1 threonine-phosphate decarboxylase [Aureimonas flava]